jgi:hypothetical protein
MQAVNHIYDNIRSRMPSMSTLPLWCLVAISLIFTVVLILKPQIVPSLVGEGHFEGEKVVVDGAKVVVDETVGEKKWEIILQSIVTIGLVGGIGLLYRNWEENRHKEQQEREARKKTQRATEEREQEAVREKINHQVEVLRNLFGSYITIHHVYKKLIRTF